jgi:hypothetical protein
MPPKRNASFGKASAAKRMAAARSAETLNQTTVRLEENRARNAATRAADTADKSRVRHESNRSRTAAARAAETAD